MAVRFCQGCRTAVVDDSLSQCQRCGVALQVPGPDEAPPWAMATAPEQRASGGAPPMQQQQAPPAQSAPPMQQQRPPPPAQQPASPPVDPRSTLQGFSPPEQQWASFDSAPTAGPADPTRLADDGTGPRNTMRLDAAAEQSPQIAPAFRPAAEDALRAVRGRGRARVAITPRWSRVVVGVLMAGAGFALLAFILPSQTDIDSELLVAGNIAAGALLGFGLIIGALGAVYRAEVETRCRSCGRTVFALRSSLGLRCPACHAYARIAWLSITVTVVFWLTCVSMAVTLAVLVLT